VDAPAQPAPYRRIGTILVEKGLITEAQLELALVEQRETERPLGEICVERFALDRLSLADALAEQWDEIQRHQAETGEPQQNGGDPAAPPLVAPDASVAESELRSLLDEAEAARVELTAKTEALGRRLAALEVLVVGVTDALKELHTPAVEVPVAPVTTAKRTRARSPRAASTRAA
jgi:hypothetical protein